MSLDVSPRPAAAGTRRSGDDRVRGLVLVGAMAALMWLVEVVDLVAGDLDAAGIRPRDPDGLSGIVAAPFLHGGFAHLLGNTVPFLVLGAAIALGGLVRVGAVTAIVAVVGGLGTWLTAPENTVHIGASGLVFGFAAYLVARGAYTRRALHLAAGLAVLAVYGTTLLFGLVPTPGVSWQGHLFGAIGGVVAARALHRSARPVGAS
ncbi:MAG TPA: rhomboid family intramembrane serine protease [Solirubrobacteraceae bacterium]|nr:rhomboid family intramembrane serine protease [Solirubrobacteraceae bacterium]